MVNERMIVIKCDSKHTSRFNINGKDQFIEINDTMSSAPSGLPSRSNRVKVTNKMIWVTDYDANATAAATAAANEVVNEAEEAEAAAKTFAAKAKKTAETTTMAGHVLAAQNAVKAAETAKEKVAAARAFAAKTAAANTTAAATAAANEAVKEEEEEEEAAKTVAAKATILAETTTMAGHVLAAQNAVKAAETAKEKVAAARVFALYQTERAAAEGRGGETRHGDKMFINVSRNSELVSYEGSPGGSDATTSTKEADLNVGDVIYGSALLKTPLNHNTQALTNLLTYISDTVMNGDIELTKINIKLEDREANFSSKSVPAQTTKVPEGTSIYMINNKYLPERRSNVAVQLATPHNIKDGPKPGNRNNILYNESDINLIDKLVRRAPGTAWPETAADFATAADFPQYMLLFVTTQQGAKTHRSTKRVWEPRVTTVVNGNGDNTKYIYYFASQLGKATWVPPPLDNMIMLPKLLMNEKGNTTNDLYTINHHRTAIEKWGSDRTKCSNRIEAAKNATTIVADRLGGGLDYRTMYNTVRDLLTANQDTMCEIVSSMESDKKATELINALYPKQNDNSPFTIVNSVLGFGGGDPHPSPASRRRVPLRGSKKSRKSRKKPKTKVN